MNLARLVILLLCSAGILLAQTQNGQSSGSSKPAARYASVLYEEVASYEQKKYAEFERDKVPYDPKLRDQVVQERKDLAAKNAAQLSAQGNLSSPDVFYLGLIYGLADDGENAIKTMQLYLEKDPALESPRAQSARYTIVKFSAPKDLMELAEEMHGEFLKHQPQNAIERVAIERLLVAAYRRLEKNELALAHAREAFGVAQAAPAMGKPVLSTSEVYAVGSTLAAICIDLADIENAAETLKQLQKLALEMPSLPYYNDATLRLADVLIESDRKPEALKVVGQALTQVKESKIDPLAQNSVLLMLGRKQAQLLVQGEQAPELKVAKWIGRQPLTLADLRGQVVLLDFWATWCAPCIAAIPQMKELYEKFKDRGVVVLGVTKYYGYAEGHPVNPLQEYAFLETFKKNKALPYPFAVADDDVNSIKYAVSAIPTTVIIDRKGIVRFIGTGYGAGGDKRVTDLLEKLTHEKDSTVQATIKPFSVKPNTGTGTTDSTNH
jgi:thiol-disulfide isomerase/thioredoxin